MVMVVVVVVVVVVAWHLISLLALLNLDPKQLDLMLVRLGVYKRGEVAQPALRVG